MWIFTGRYWQKVADEQKKKPCAITLADKNAPNEEVWRQVMLYSLLRGLNIFSSYWTVSRYEELWHVLFPYSRLRICADALRPLLFLLFLNLKVAYFALFTFLGIVSIFLLLFPVYISTSNASNRSHPKPSFRSSNSLEHPTIGVWPYSQWLHYFCL